jgi:signal transduction histidine kinase
LKFNGLVFLAVFLAFIEGLIGNSINVFEIDQRLSEIDENLKQLPSRPAYPVGGVRGYKWSKACEFPWVELQFSESVTLESLALVPLATFEKGKVNAYGLSPFLKIILLGPGKVVFDGMTREHCREASPLFLEFKNGEKNISGIRIELESNVCEAPYLAIDEIFAFSNGVNIALGSKVTGNSDLNFSEISNAPSNLVNGQSSLGQPIFKKGKQDDVNGVSISNLKKFETSYLEFLFEEESEVHEVRLYSLYAPINEMLLDQYGSGFPSSFRLVSINKDKEDLNVFHEGPFYNPGRNLTIFVGSKHKASGIRLYVVEFYQKQFTKKRSFSLSEVQIISRYNENLAPKSLIKMVGIESSRGKMNHNKINLLTDDQTTKGYLLDLQDWLRKLSQKNQLTIEKESLIKLQGEYLAQRTFWFRMTLGLLFIVIVVTIHIWFRTKEKQKLNLSLVRKDIANDLHDEIGSNLASIRLMMARLKDEKVVGTVREILDESEEALREMVWALSPQKLSLIEKLRESTARLLTDHEVKFEIQSPEAWDNLHIKDRQHVVFWFKEALNNIQKHAEAKKVNIKLEGNESGMLRLCIRDDGKGMDLEPHNHDYDHLARLKARALKLSGVFRVISKLGEGCEVCLNFKSHINA